MTSSPPASRVLIQLQLHESTFLIQLHLPESDAVDHGHCTRVHPVALLRPLDSMPKAPQKPGA